MNYFNFATFLSTSQATQANVSDGNLSPKTNSSSFSFFEGDAIVIECIQPNRSGCVRFQGVYWFARCDENVTLLPGATVAVVGRRKLTLIVR